ncbi:hypothetical protein HK405_014293, partial [Cladochytrium tenue]
GGAGGSVSKDLGLCNALGPTSKTDTGLSRPLRRGGEPLADAAVAAMAAAAESCAFGGRWRVSELRSGHDSKLVEEGVDRNMKAAVI